ncbi:MAG TPA: hypothetical protein PKD24_03860 [Pyrinomonadaceae bacterium]|nr:hypothetical protein [Pyrinomonadaceae bacterium]
MIKTFNIASGGDHGRFEIERSMANLNNNGQAPRDTVEPVIAENIRDS